MGWRIALVFLCLIAPRAGAQTLINVDFGVGSQSKKTGWSAAGSATNDYWNLYRHYDPKYTPGMPLVANGVLSEIKLADGTASPVTLSVTNAPGVWGNATGDPMMDAYIFAQDGSNIVVTVSRLAPGRYQFFLYGHAEADVTAEQNSVFLLKSGTNVFGPFAGASAPGWKSSQPWAERHQYVAFRDVPVFEGQPVIVEVAPGAGGVPVLNGMQILSRGTSPPELNPTAAAAQPFSHTNLIVHSIRYRGKMKEREARFSALVTVESLTTNEISGELFQGDVAMLVNALPPGLRLQTQGKRIYLTASSPGSREFEVELIAKIAYGEPWNQISFTGPQAAIASVEAQAVGLGMELQMTSGTATGKQSGEGEQSDRVEGVIGADGVLALRWRSKTAEINRKALVSVETHSQVAATPAVLKYTTTLNCEILQGNMPSLTVLLPQTHALTQLKGEQIRDWQVKTEGVKQVLTVEFIKPIEKSYTLALYSEQALPATAQSVEIMVPQAMNVERESGDITITGDDALVEIEAIHGLRQVNAPAGALAAYRFNTRPASVTARVKRIEPVIRAQDRLTLRLEETRLLAQHSIGLVVEKAGIYSLDMLPQTEFKVTQVRGEGIDDWKVGEGTLRIQFHSRVLGPRQIEISLEQAFEQFPTQIVAHPLKITGATSEKAQIGAAAIPGIRMKTAELTGLREIPVLGLRQRSDELLAYAAEQGQWRLAVSVEKLPARCVTEVFNLITIGDGLVGGSATLRYGILNQGIQELRVRVPDHWKNIEFTGSGIRRKDKQDKDWVIGLQDKAWGGYTLVVTYDFAFDPKGGTLSLGGVHAVDVERETGAIAITSASGMQLKPSDVTEPLRRIDETELAAGDRALIARPVLLAYQYAGDQYRLSIEVKRFDELAVLEAVADRIQLTTALTEDGQMLTQASFMVKNNAKQYQRFRLPGGAEFWSCYVNNQPSKAERDGEWLLAPLPREANRDQAFAVDLVYAQKLSSAPSWRPGKLMLEAPGTDVPNTYAEWQLYVRPSQHLAGFGGSMTVAPGAVYEWRDAWKAFLAFYRDVLNEGGAVIVGVMGVVLLSAMLCLTGIRRGWNGIAVVLAVLCVVIVLAGMLLPSLSKAKAKSLRSRSAPQQARLFEDKAASVQTGKTEQEMESLNIKLPLPAFMGTPTDIPLTAQPHGEPQVAKSDAALPSGGRAEARGVAQSPPSQNRQQVAAGRFALNSSTSSGVTGSGGGMGGAGAVEGSEIVPAVPAAQPMGASAPMAAGVRPIRIEIPRDGTAFSFTKVLNVGEEPLTISAKITSKTAFLRLRSLMQAAVFLAGCFLLFRRWMAGKWNSLSILVALLLIVGSVGHVLLSHRLLHWTLIATAPMFLFALLIWFLWLIWPKRKSAATVVTACVWLLFASAAQGQAGAQPEESRASTNGVVIISTLLEGQVQDATASIDATIRLSFSKTNQIFQLFGDDLAVQNFQAEPAQAQLWRQGRFLCVYYPQAGEVIVKLKGLLRLGGDASRRQLNLRTPPSLYTHLNLALDQADAEVEFPSAVSVQTKTDGKRTLIDAVVGTSEGVDMRWTPRVKKAAEIAATVFCRNTALVTIGGGAVNARSILDYQISQGELRQLQIRLPDGQRLLRVEGASIRTWEQKDENAESLLRVELLKNAAPSYRLIVETEYRIESLPASARIDIPHAVNVKRETGAIAIRGADELNVTVDAGKLQRVDVEDFSKDSGIESAGIVSVFRFLEPGFSIVARAEIQAPQVEAVYRNRIQIGEEQLRLTASVDYSIKRAGVFGVKMAIPLGYRIEKVEGEKVHQWIERETNGVRTIEISLKERTLGACPVRVELVLPWSSMPKVVHVAGVMPLDAPKSTGYLAVLGDAGIAIKAATVEGLIEIPASNLLEMAVPTASMSNGGPSPSGNALQQGRVAANSVSSVSGAVLAFKCKADEKEQAAWKLDVATEALEPWIRAETVQHAIVTDTLVTGRAQIRLEVANAPSKQFTLRVPTSLKNVEIFGADIRRRDQSNELWRVELQNKVRGAFLLTVTWEQPRSNPTNGVEIAFVGVAGAERETGIIGVEARPPLQAVVRTASDLIPIDAQEVPDWAQRTSQAAAMAFRYLRPGSKLSLDIRRYQEAEVLQALADSVRYASVVADDGQTMTEMVLQIRNNGRQHLEMEFPAGVKVWSAFVGGQPVRPSEQTGKVLLPLERSAPDGSPVAVEVIYTGKTRFPRDSGEIELISPKMDVPVKNARWELYLPPDYRYSDFRGTMTREEGAERIPMVVKYTLSEYEQQESAKRIANDQSTLSNLSSARYNLKKGNVKDAVDNYRQVRLQQRALTSEANEQLRQIETDIKRMNANNLIESQNAFFSRNNGQIANDSLDIVGADPMAQQKIAATSRYDTEAAERQWTKLQQAQEVDSQKAQPLRVNLPKRGQMHVFNQLLQTEIRKTMTIQFHSSNVKSSGQGRKMLAAIGGLIGLWITLAVMRWATQWRRKPQS
jgi:hypothetical protein